VHLAMMLRPKPGPDWKLAAQAGVEHAVVCLNGLLTEKQTDRALLAQLKEELAEAGLDLQVAESDPFPMGRIKLGLPGRDEDADRYCALLQTMGELGIPVMCYNFMAQVGWYRSSVDVPTRGGALASGFDYEDIRSAPFTPAGVVEEGRVWDNLCWFLEHVLPAAESAGVGLAAHPDDPPVSPLMGIGRVLTSPEAYDRLLGEFPSPANGVGFCQGTFATMGVDIPATIRHFGCDGRILFAHFRDIRGSATRFVETFHDVGQTDMVAAVRAYREVGFSGSIRPDHGPTMEGESNDRPGYAMMGRIFAAGYLRGLMQATGGGALAPARNRGGRWARLR
jgi:mannonate dehydratase